MIVQYSLCDIILLIQIFYYRRTNPVRLVSSPTPAVVISDEAGESVPLLAERASHSEKKGRVSYRTVLLYASALTFVVATGTIAWLLSRSQNQSDEPPTSTTPKDVIEWRSQILGWSSALLYCKFGFGFRWPLGFLGVRRRIAAVFFQLQAGELYTNVSACCAACFLSGLPYTSDL